MASVFLDTFALIFFSLVQKNMLSSNRCEICGCQTGCSHSRDIENRNSWKKDLKEITEPERLLAPMKTKESNTMSKDNLIDNNVTKCNFCDSEVSVPWMTDHIFAHAHNNYVEEDGVGYLANNKPRNIVSIEAAKPKPVVVPTEPIIDSEVRQFLSLLPTVKLKEYETFQFRRIKDLSIISATSKNGNYSDLSIAIWFHDSVSSYSSGYAGANHSYLSKPSERLQINLCYDSVEDYFTMSGKIYRRSGYSEFDTEDSMIPTRVCNQEDLQKELISCLLFHCVSPKAVYLMMRKRMKSPITTIKDKNEVEFLATSNYKALIEAKAISSYPTNWDNDDVMGMGMYGS